MGNSLTSDVHREQRISSIENLKQIPFIDSNQNGSKKKSILFSRAAWKRLVESTRRRGTKGSKVNPSLSYPDGSLYQHSHGNHVHSKHSNGLPAGHDSLKKSQSMYVITNKGPGLNNSVVDTKPVYQQPRVNSKETNMQALQEQYRNMSVKQSALSQVKPVESGRREMSKSDEDKMSARNVQADKKQQHARQPQKTTASSAPRKVVVQASTGELLRCLGEFICRRCRRVPGLDPSDVISWLQGVDRSLLMQGWQDITFIMPSSVVFVYMLCREMVPEDLTSVFEVQCIVLTCLYMSYSYMGNEISYPLRPFLIEGERFAFWSRCCRIMDKMSRDMLRINNDTPFFTSLIRELKSYGSSRYQHHQQRPPPAYTRTAVAPSQAHSMRPIPVGGVGY